MKGISFLCGIIFIALLSGCTDKQPEIDKLKAENTRLSAELDEYKNGEKRLLALIDQSYINGDFENTKSFILTLIEKHPECPKIPTLKLQLPVLEQKIAAAAKEKLEKENIGNLGCWLVSNYVDNFGDPTKKKFLETSKLLKGTFSNTATQNSLLYVQLYIEQVDKICIMLFEYGGNNPVKNPYNKEYTILVKDKDGNKTKLFCNSLSDRLKLFSSDAKKLHAILLKGGTVSFHIIEQDSPTTQYNFTIPDANFYGNAFAKLTSK